MSQTSRQRTLHTLSEFRPAFRAIASGLTDLDLVFIEEAFERLLLDYDRACGSLLPRRARALADPTRSRTDTGVFSSMGIPSCLWRRTGEIYKGNKEFAALGESPPPHRTLRGGTVRLTLILVQSGCRLSICKGESWRSTS